MTEKWLSLTPNPPQIPVFYTLTKIHKPNLVERPTYLAVLAQQNESHHLLITYLLQPIAKVQESYLKNTTHFLTELYRENEGRKGHNASVNGRYKSIY